MIPIRKKYIIGLVFLTAFTIPVFSFSIASIAQGEYKLFDIPLIHGIAYFQQTLWNFYSVARTLATLLAIVGICWNSFRLWAGTQEVRRAVVDIACKFVLFIFLFNSYPLIVNFIMDTALNMGMTVGGGYNTINTKFYAFREQMENTVELAQQQLTNLLSGGAKVTPHLAAQLAKRTYVTEDEQEAFLANISGVNIKELTNMPAYVAAMGGWDQSVNRSVGEFYKKMEKQRQDEFIEAADISDAVVTLRAMDEIFMENSLYNEDDPSYNTENNIPQYLFSPYMRDANGNQTDLLSPGALIKMSVIISEITSKRIDQAFQAASDSEDADEEAGVIQERGWFDKKIGATLAGIQQLLLSLFMTLAIVLSVIFYVIQYVMCIFEYFLVTSVGVIFIPFCLFDGTKNFTAKLVTLFSAYFIKILVMTLCLFWVLGTFIDVGVTIMVDKNPASMLNVAYFIFTTMLCWVVTQNGPAIAVTILNGSPQLSMGEFLHAAGTAAAGAMLARRAAHTAGTVAQAAGKTGQAAVRGVQTQVATWQGAGQAINEMDAFKGMSGRQKFMAQMGAFATMTGERIKNSAVTLATGNQSRMDGKGDRPLVSSVGQGHSEDFHNKNGSQDYNDARENARQAAIKRFGGEDGGKKEKDDDKPAATSSNEKRV